MKVLSLVVLGGILAAGMASAAMPVNQLQKVSSDSREGLPEVNPVEARYDNACANLAAAYVSNTEASHAEKLPDWKNNCASHPKQAVCRDTITIVMAVRGSSMGLVCGRSAHAEKPVLVGSR